MRPLFPLALSLAALVFLGCGDPKTPEQQTEKTPATPAEEKHEHEHPDKGPHDGSLIELGDEEYHAEMVIDQEQGRVTIYVLDSHVEKPVPIDAQEITISEESQSYPLQAKPTENDPPGQSSRFVSEDEALSKLLSGHVHARLILKISGKSFNGQIDSH